MIIKTKFNGLILVKNKKFNDSRGYFKELIIEKNINVKFPFHVMSFSKKNIIRGLHIQTKIPQGKFLTVIKGKIFEVAVDLRKDSKTYGKCFSKILSAKNSLSIYIPPGFAHGFCALDKENFVVYSCTQYRNARSETGIKYNDKDLNIKWPIKKPTLSLKDRKNYSLKEFYDKNNG
jgi:dTDP-4-dehydrorhamnose 3,5-epimerase